MMERWPEFLSTFKCPLITWKAISRKEVYGHKQWEVTNYLYLHYCNYQELVFCTCTFTGECFTLSVHEDFMCLISV